MCVGKPTIQKRSKEKSMNGCIGTYQLVMDFTRVTRASRTLIDVVVSDDKSATTCDVLHTASISDHSVLLLNMKSERSEKHNKLISVFDKYICINSKRVKYLMKLSGNE